MESIEAFLPFLSGTLWENGNDECTDWLNYQHEIETALSMADRPAPLSGKSLLRYLARTEASSDFQEELDENGFSFYKLYTLPQVSQAQREKLQKSKQFKRHIGRCLCVIIIIFISTYMTKITGKGSSGVCVLVYDRDKRMLQVMKIQHLRSSGALRNFRKEVKMLTRLSSSSVVRIDGKR